MQRSVRRFARGRVHWLIALPIGFLVLASLMFVQHAERRHARASGRELANATVPEPGPAPAPPATPASTARAVLAEAPILDDSAGPVATPTIVDAKPHPVDGEADLLQFQRGMAELQRKRPKPALAIFGAILAEPPRLAGIAMAQHDMRHASESQLALEQLLRDHSRDAPYRIAQVYAWRGQPDEAFAWLDRAFVQRDGGLADVKYDPALRALHADARFRAFLARRGQPD